MEKKKYTYDLTFEEVLEEIWYKDCWYQGNNFADGVVIFANADGTGILKDFLAVVQIQAYLFLPREFVNKCIVVYIPSLMLKGEFDVISSFF